MANSYFQFKQFTINQDKCAMKVTTDSCLFGAWVAAQLSHSKATTLLDIGTGTGLLSLMIAQLNPLIKIDAIEIDKKAFEQATENAAQSKWAERIKIILGDVKEMEIQKKYDVVISNPPFYENELKGEKTEKNIAHHNEGLLLTDLLSTISNLLKDDGEFYLLLPYKRYSEFEKICKQELLTIELATLVKQSANHNYFRLMIRGKKQTSSTPEKIQEDSLSICNEPNEYSLEFKTLLKEYYLYL